MQGGVFWITNEPELSISNYWSQPFQVFIVQVNASNTQQLGLYCWQKRNSVYANHRFMGSLNCVRSNSSFHNVDLTGNNMANRNTGIKPGEVIALVVLLIETWF